MSKFIRVDAEGNVQQLQPELFTAEEDNFEDYVQKNPAILGENIFIIASKIDTGQGKRLDILAVEEVSEGIAQPVIVELTTIEANTDIMLQVLRNANWALANSDSVKNYAAQSKAKFKDIDCSSIKVIILAPGITEELLEFSNYVTGNISIRFLEFKRFKDDAGDLLVLDWKTPATPSGLISAAKKEWDWNKYEIDLNINPDRIKIAKYIFNSLVILNSEMGWGLNPTFRKSYIPFKKAGRTILQIELWTKPCLVINLPKKPRELGLSEIYPDIEQSYDDKYSQYWFRITDANTDIADFAGYIEKAMGSLQV